MHRLVENASNFRLIVISYLLCQKYDVRKFCMRRRCYFMTTCKIKIGAREKNMKNVNSLLRKRHSVYFFGKTRIDDPLTVKSRKT